MINPNGGPTFQVKGRLNIQGGAEFLGIRHHIDGAPTSTIRVWGIEIDFTNPAEADQFAQQARVMADQLRLAQERSVIARGPKTGDDDPLGLKGQPR